MKPLKYKTMHSPVGLLKLIINEKALVAILWEVEIPNRVKLDHRVEDLKHPLLLETEKQLNEYFLRTRKAFDLPLEMNGGTPFQQEVWYWLTQIPYGTTWSYKDIALRMNNPGAVRAVGSANGRNPLSIIVPCHRVIASDKTLGGFAGGLHRKQILLDLESAP